MNQGALTESIKNLDLAGSKTSLPDKNIVSSKVYKDLETRNNTLQAEMNNMSTLNKELIQKIENLSKELREGDKSPSISDSASIISANEDLKVQLKSKKQQIVSMQKRVASVERDRDTKEYMVKAL